MVLRVMALTMLLAGCGGPLSLLTGGGPNVAANVQAGAENRQAGVSVERQAPVVSIRPKANVRDVSQEQNEVRTDSIGTFNAGLPWWVWIIIGMFIPGPVEIFRQIAEVFKK